MAPQRLDHKVLALDTALSITSAVVSSALGASWLGSLILAALAPALLTFVHHPGTHKRRRTAVGLALFALLHLLQALLARVRGRPARPRVAGWGHAVRFGELTAALAFAITVVTLTAPELVLGDALVSDRSLTLFPAKEAKTCPVAKRTPTDRETGITTVKPKDRKPKPPDRPVPTPDRPHPRSLDPTGPPLTSATPSASPTPTPEAPEAGSEPKSPRIRKSRQPQTETPPQPDTSPQTEETPQPQTEKTPEPQPEVSPRAEERAEPPPAEETPERRPKPRPPRPEPEAEPDPDKTPPVFTGSREIVVTTLRRPRTLIPYPVPPAKDDRDPQPVVTCDASSVEAGTTAKVSCTARDSAGNSTEQPFYVTIQIGDG